MINHLLYYILWHLWLKKGQVAMYELYNQMKRWAIISLLMRWFAVRAQISNYSRYVRIILLRKRVGSYDNSTAKRVTKFEDVE